MTSSPLHAPAAEAVLAMLRNHPAPERPCILEDEVQITARQLLARSSAVARGFADLGVAAGDRVAIWLPNRAAWLVAFLACAQLGAIAVSINTRFRSSEVADLLRRSGSKLLLYWPGYRQIDFDGILAQCPPDALQALTHLVPYGEDAAPQPAAAAGRPAVPFAELLQKPPLEGGAGGADSPCIIFTTSGTTKAPKLVLHRQANVVRHARNVAHQYGLGPHDRFLQFPPFCGVFGFCSAMAALAAGTPLILAPAWNAETYAGLVEQHGATHLTMSNEAASQLLATREGSEIFPSLRYIVSANLNPAHADVAERAARKGVCVIGLYGSSEVQALFSHGRPADALESRSRAGGYPASSLARVRARDPQTGQLCAPGDAGELEILAPESRFVEYFNDPQATADAFTPDGYFRTGDLATVDADGGFTYLARMGDTLRLGGFLVSPAEIEDLLQQHPAVESCQVVGVAYQDAMRPVAFVIPRAGQAVVPDALIADAAARLARYKVPLRVYAVAEFPTTPSANGSKVQKNKLREMAEARLAEEAARG